MQTDSQDRALSSELELPCDIRSRFTSFIHLRARKVENKHTGQTDFLTRAAFRWLSATLIARKKRCSLNTWTSSSPSTAARCGFPWFHMSKGLPGAASNKITTRCFWDIAECHQRLRIPEEAPLLVFVRTRPDLYSFAECQTKAKPRKASQTKTLGSRQLHMKRE